MHVFCIILNFSTQSVQHLKDVEHLKDAEHLKDVEHFKDVDHLKDEEHLMNVENPKDIEHLEDISTGSAVYSRPIETIKFHGMCAHWHKKFLGEIFPWELHSQHKFFTQLFFER